MSATAPATPSMPGTPSVDRLRISRLTHSDRYAIPRIDQRNGSPGRRGQQMGFTNIRNQAEAERLIAELMRAFDLHAG